MIVGVEMKISFFIGGMFGGGAERVISILANYYAEKGWDVEIIMLLYSKVEYVLHPSIKIVSMAAGEGSYFKKLPVWLKKIRNYLKTEKPDRVVSFIGRINMVVLTASIGLSIPVIVSERNDPRQDGRGRLLIAYCNLIYRKAAAIVFQTRYEQSCFSRKIKQMHIIPNPVSVSAEAKPCERMEIVTAGRLIEQKNQRMLIEAFAKVRERHPEAVLKIYGDGHLKEELQKCIDGLGIHDVAELCGNVSDLHERITGAAAFVLTSEFEGLSNALIEAMMLGIPCITTDYPGAEELIKDKKSGLLIPRGNVRELVKALDRLLMDTTLANRLRDICLKEAEKYKKEIVLSQWEKVIEGQS